MTESRLPATIDAIVAAFTAAGVKTWDGPFLTGDFDDAVHVGYDGDPEGSFTAATLDQEWAGTVGAKKRDETMDITCAAISLSGDANAKSARDGVYALLELCGAALRANPGLSFLSPYVAGVRPQQLFYEPDPDGGLLARLVFVISVKTRI